LIRGYNGPSISRLGTFNFFLLYNEHSIQTTHSDQTTQTDYSKGRHVLFYVRTIF
jgi:hypothetical protein